MPIKRSRITQPCVHSENDVVGVDVENQSVEQSSSVNGARNKAARTSTTVEHVVIPPPPLDREVIFTIGSPQRTPPVQMQLHGGGLPVHSYPLLPPTFLHICNYCKKRIQPHEDTYMNGDLEAYCSRECRYNFNVMRLDLLNQRHQ